MRGPFTFETMAQMWKEETIDEKTIIWTNEKLKSPETGKKVKLEQWKAIKDLGSPLVTHLTQVAASLPDRRVQQYPVQMGIDYGVPPQVPIYQ